MSTSTTTTTTCPRALRVLSLRRRRRRRFTRHTHPHNTPSNKKNARKQVAEGLFPHHPLELNYLNIQAADVATEDLVAHCRAQIAGYICPRSVEFRTELPLSAAGKVLKYELRAPFWAGRSRHVN